MKQQDKKFTYRVYARKSSETEDRQTLSISSQIDECKKLADSHGIKINDEEIATESKSAKEPYSREAFENLLKEIESGKVNSIIAWHPNRLSRNAIDAARLVDLLDRGKLHQIITNLQTYKKTPSDIFVFQLMTSQAKMENDNKSIDVKRGLKKKCLIGYPPRLTIIGYKNDEGRKGECRWLPDPKNFNLVKKLLELFLSGKYSVRKLQQYADKVLCIRTTQRRREGSKPMSVSGIYNLLGNPIPAGFFYADIGNGEKERCELHKSLPRMISEEQYWQIQAMLRRKGKPRQSKYYESFPYKESLRCGNCNGSVTAEHKYQLICPKCKKKFTYPNKDNCPTCGIKIDKMENPKYLHYIYYHCIHKNSNCKEGSIQQVEIDNYMTDYVRNNLEISPALRNWCLKHFDEIMNDDQQSEIERRISWEREKNNKQNSYKELIMMKAKKLIEENEFMEMKESLKKDIKDAEDSLLSIGGSAIKIMTEARKNFDFATGVSEIFENGNYKDKLEALSEFCSNLTLKDKKLRICEKKVYSIIIKGLKEAKAKNEQFEPKKYEADNEKTEVFTSVRPTLLRW